MAENMVILEGLMKTTKELLGARIKELRKLSKMTQEKLAEQIGVDPKYVSFIEVGRSSPSLEAMEKIAQALDVEIKDMFEFSHQEAREVSIEQIDEMLSDVTEEQLKIIHRIVKAFKK